jgi:hypothetical protein
MQSPERIQTTEHMVKLTRVKQGHQSSTPTRPREMRPLGSLGVVEWIGQATLEEHVKDRLSALRQVIH